jgi:hypothetical protein
VDPVTQPGPLGFFEVTAAEIFAQRLLDETEVLVAAEIAAACCSIRFNM